MCRLNQLQLNWEPLQRQQQQDEWEMTGRW
jgi:hypothetical protein